MTLTFDMESLLYAVIYCRASSGEQIDSCDQQERACRERAKELGLVVSECYRDDGISGSRHDRPAYQRLLAAAERKGFGAILLWKQSRLGRDQPEIERAMRRLEDLGLRLITIDGYDTRANSLKTRKMIRVVRGAMDEAYLDDLREDTLRGLEDRFDEGYWCGGRPYGYRLVEVASDTEKDAYGRPKRKGSRLEVDPAQASVVREIFRRYAEGDSPQGIAADLNERAVASPGSRWNRTKRRCGGWARSGIWQMLRNSLYSGTYYWRRAEWQRTEKGRKVRARSETEWKGHAGNAPELAIVDCAVWERVQARLAVNRGRNPDARLKSGGRAVYMLSGLLQCGKCGAHFVMDSATHYRCGSVVDGKACNNDIRVRRDLAERVILQPILEELLSPVMIEAMIREMRSYYEERVAEIRSQRTMVPAQLEELNRRILRLQERLKSGDPDLTADELLGIIQKAESKRADLLAAEPGAERIDKVLGGVPAAAARYRAQIDKGLQGHRDEATRARVAVRKLLGDKISLLPAECGGHLIAHLEFRRAALLPEGVGSVGSGGRI